MKGSTMTKFVFVAVLAVLAAVLYSIPAQSAGKGNGGAPSHGANASPAGSPSPSAKAQQNSNGQFQDERKFGRERAAEKKSDRPKAILTK
jgi:hypothetical protein